MARGSRKVVKKKEEKKGIVFSLCGRCNKIIKFGEEIQLEDSINCQDCFHAIIDRCHNCYRPIYKDELGYEITPNWGIGNIFSASQSDKVIHCNWCYQKWLIKKEKKKKWWRERKWVLLICSVSLLFITFFWLFLTLVEKWKKISCLHWGWIVFFVILSFAFSVSITFVLYEVISIEFISRYNGKFDRGTKKIKINNIMNDSKNEPKLKPDEKFCEDCGFKYKETQMLQRSDGKWFCLRCTPRNQKR